MLFGGVLGMIEATERGAWRELEAQLRRFVARRVQVDADIDDVLQDVLLRIQRGLPSLRDEVCLGAWVYQVARSAIADYRRAMLRQRAGSKETLDEDIQFAASTPDSEGVERELLAYMVPFVTMLPHPYREALTLTELEGMTQKKAASMLAVSVSGMKSRVQRGRRLLRSAIERCCSIALDARGNVLSCELRSDACAPKGCCEQTIGWPFSMDPR